MRDSVPTLGLFYITLDKLVGLNPFPLPVPGSGGVKMLHNLTLAA